MLEREELAADEAMRDLVRSVHDDLDLPDGFRAEIVGGQIVMAPSPFGIHAYIVTTIRRAVDPVLPPGYACMENVTIEEPQIDRFVPDIAVWPLELMLKADRQRIFPADQCLFAAEVTSPRQASRDYAKADGYARGGVPTYLLVDASERKAVVFTDPTPDGYTTQHTVPFGRPITLAFEGGSEAVIDTSTF